MRRCAIKADLFSSARIEFESELRGDDDLRAIGGESFAYELFVCEWAVDFGGIEEGDAPVHGCPDDRDHLFPVSGWTITEAHSHAAKANRRDFQVAFSQFALFHGFSV